MHLWLSSNMCNNRYIGEYWFRQRKKNYAVAAAVFNQLNDPSLGNITDLYVGRSKIRQNVQKTHLKSGSSAIRQEWLRFMSPIFENSIVETAVNI